MTYKIDDEEYMKRENLTYEMVPASTPIQEGDAGIIIRANGKIEVFSTGNVDISNLTEAQNTQAILIAAICNAVQNDAVLHDLVELLTFSKVKSPVIH